MTFKIGDWVEVNAVTSMEYDEHDQRIAQRRAVEPFHAQITGLAVKALGKYTPGRRGYYEDEDEPPTFLRTGSAVLWLVRAGLINRELLVHTNDMSAVLSRSDLPRSSPRPKYITPEPVA